MMGLSSMTLAGLAVAVVIVAWLLRRLRRLVQLTVVVALVAALPDLMRGQVPAWAMTVWNAAGPVVGPTTRALWTWLQTMLPR